MSEPLSLQRISYRVGPADVLTNVSLDVFAHEFVTVMGRNGAGKTTLLDVIAGLRQPSSGRIRLGGRPFAQWDPRSRARAIAHLPQILRSELPFRAGELVMMGRYPHGHRWRTGDADEAIVAAAMQRTDCLGLRDRSLSTLSGGERQRVLLAACLAQQAKLLLFDEPSTFLDVDWQLQCFSLLRDECRQGAACLAVTHDLNLALTYATRIVVLDGGRVVVDVSAEEAAQSTSWLSYFSPRLRLVCNSEGRPWISYA
jgi:iron complex transport system ATP-binding protein